MIFGNNSGINPSEQALLTVTHRAMEQTHEAMGKVTQAMERMVVLEEDVKRLHKVLEQHMAAEEKMFSERVEREKQIETTLVGVAKTVGNLQALMSERAIEVDAQMDKDLSNMKQSLREEFFKYREEDIRKTDERVKSIAERFDGNCSKVNDRLNGIDKQIQRLEDSSSRFYNVIEDYNRSKEELLKLKTDHDRLEKIGMAVATALVLTGLKMGGVI